MPKTNGDDWKQASKKAIVALEANSSAEVVIAMRPSARPFALGDVLIGACISVGVTAFLLYSEGVYALHTFLWAPLVAAVAFGMLSSRLAITRRLLDVRGSRHKEVRELAQSLFVSLGITNTKNRTGILILFCRREGLVEFISDVGVDRAHLEEEQSFVEAERCTRERWRAGASPHHLAEALAKMAPALAEVLPKGKNDVNELADELAQ